MGTAGFINIVLLAQNNGYWGNPLAHSLWGAEYICGILVLFGTCYSLWRNAVNSM